VSALERYLDLFKRYNDGKITSEEFRTEYLEAFLHENSGLEERLYQILDQAFGDAEMFELDPVLYAELNRVKPGVYLSEKEFRQRTTATFMKLKEYSARLN
jgi:hypothetical protein